MAEQLGDDHEVGAAAHERGRDVCLRMCTVVAASRPAAAAMPVMMSCAPRTLGRCPRWLRNNAGLSLVAGPVVTLGEPARERRTELWVGRNLADAFAFAEDS